MSATSARHGADEQPRLRWPDHAQTIPAPVKLDKRLDPDHQARVVWEFVGGLDRSALVATLHATTPRPGRDHTEPRLLVALWLQATVEGLGSARALDRLCRAHLAYLGLCGAVTLN